MKRQSKARERARAGYQKGGHYGWGDAAENKGRKEIPGTGTLLHKGARVRRRKLSL